METAQYEPAPCQDQYVRTLGVDLATTDGSTGICEVDWRARTGIVEVGRFTDDLIARRIKDVRDAGGWAAIDAPFGFPAAFALAVEQWRSTGFVSPATDHAIRRRLTDEYVAARQSVVKAEHLSGGWNPWPLSSVVDLITPTVIRCARILTIVNARTPTDRVGLTSRIVEAYPVAALRCWQVPTYKYKTVAADCRLIFEDLVGRTGVREPTQRGPLRNGCDDDAVDAFVCALVARAVASSAGATGPIAAGGVYAAQLSTIREEGWIHLPPPGHSLEALQQRDRLKRTGPHDEVLQ